jgi:hypothetical protein
MFGQNEADKYFDEHHEEAGKIVAQGYQPYISYFSEVNRDELEKRGREALEEFYRRSVAAEQYYDLVSSRGRVKSNDVREKYDNVYVAVRDLVGSEFDTSRLASFLAELTPAAPEKADPKDC